MSEPPSYPPPPPPPPDGGGYPRSSGGYGYPPPVPGGYGYPPPRSAGTNGMAIASLVCSLVGWVCLVVVGPILGIVFGYVALGQIKQTGQDGRGMAIAGVVIGGVVIGFFVLIGIAQLFISH